MLTIHNSLTRKKEPFVPINPGKIGIYVCGITVYDYCHLGHARMLVVFDMVVRYLRRRGYDVNYVRNITDIEDKIIKRAVENNEPINELTERFIVAMHEDEAMLAILPPDHEPRATEHIEEILHMIKSLVDKGYAYQAANGDVYYRVRKFGNYGALSGKAIDDLRSGARIDLDEDKEDPLDFVLWKSSKPDEPNWPSAWGAGRPGWHIECSAMSTGCLGDTFDIHAGGMDLQFPHHENEIAQSEGATGKKFVHLWMHNGYVQVDKEKMSKSLGNFSTIREILQQDVVPERMGEVIRFMILTSHYRSPLNYSAAALANAREGLGRFYRVMRKAVELKADNQSTATDDAYADRFFTVMDDDFNTPEAIAVLFDLARDLNATLDKNEKAQAAVFYSTLKQLASVLGLLDMQPEKFLAQNNEKPTTAQSGSLDESEIQQLIKQRQKARANKDWQEADRIRDELEETGVVLIDQADGSTTWRLKT